METPAFARCGGRCRHPGFSRCPGAFGPDLWRMTGMTDLPSPLDLTRLKVHPLADRLSQSQIEEILVEPADPPAACPAESARLIHDCALRIRSALERRAADRKSTRLNSSHVSESR